MAAYHQDTLTCVPMCVCVCVCVAGAVATWGRPRRVQQLQTEIFSHGPEKGVWIFPYYVKLTSHSLFWTPSHIFGSWIRTLILLVFTLLTATFMKVFFGLFEVLHLPFLIMNRFLSAHSTTAVIVARSSATNVSTNQCQVVPIGGPHGCVTCATPFWCRMPPHTSAQNPLTPQTDHLEHPYPTSPLTWCDPPHCR